MAIIAHCTCDQGGVETNWPAVCISLIEAVLILGTLIIIAKCTNGTI